MGQPLCACFLGNQSPTPGGSSEGFITTNKATSQALVYQHWLPLYPLRLTQRFSTKERKQCPQGVPLPSGNQQTSLSLSPISSPPSFLRLLVISSQSIPETGGHLLWEAFLAFSHTALFLLFGISLSFRVPPARKTLAGFKHLIPAWHGAPKRPVLPPASPSMG